MALSLRIQTSLVVWELCGDLARNSTARTAGRDRTPCLAYSVLFRLENEGWVSNGWGTSTDMSGNGLFADATVLRWLGRRR